MSAARKLRQRLYNPPNAVADTEINLRNGWPVTARRKPAQRPLLKVLPITHQRSPYVWPGNLCGEFWLWESPEDIPRPPLTIKYIVASVASVFGVDPVDIMSQRRHRHFVVPRQVAMTLARRLTLHSYPEIGRRIGGRDHTTCLHAVRKLEPYAEQVAAELGECGTVHAWATAMKARLKA